MTKPIEDLIRLLPSISNVSNDLRCGLGDSIGSANKLSETCRQLQTIARELEVDKLLSLRDQLAKSKQDLSSLEGLLLEQFELIKSMRSDAVTISEAADTLSRISQGLSHAVSRMQDRAVRTEHDLIGKPTASDNDEPMIRPFSSGSSGPLSVTLTPENANKSLKISTSKQVSPTDSGSVGEASKHLFEQILAAIETVPGVRIVERGEETVCAEAPIMAPGKLKEAVPYDPTRLEEWRTIRPIAQAKQSALANEPEVRALVRAAAKARHLIASIERTQDVDVMASLAIELQGSYLLAALQPFMPNGLDATSQTTPPAGA